MASLSLPRVLLEHSKASLARQMRNLPIDHPLLHLQIPFGTRMDRDYFAHMIGESSLLQDFERQNSNLPPDRTIKWKKFLQQDTLNSYLKQPGILQHYIRPEARSHSSGTDILFKSPDLITQSKVYAWRANTAFRNKICICNGAFNRRHARDRLPIHQFTPTLQEAYEQYRTCSVSAEIRQELDDKKYKKDFCFTFVDFCLNQDINLFLECFDLISSFVT